MRPILFAFAIVVAACTSAAEHADESATPTAGTTARAGSLTVVADSSARRGARGTDATAATTTTSAGETATPTRAATSASPLSRTVAFTPAGDPTPGPAIRALYVNRWASQSTRRMAKLIAAADSTEINGLVIDMKDEFGLNYHSLNPAFERNGGAANKLRSVARLLDTLKAHDIVPIARIVVFKDSVTARIHPEWTIRKTDGSIWRDKKGIAWVNPYHHELWNYNIGVAEELAKLGFPEIQFDYIRFPEPYKSLPKQVFPDANGVSKPDALAAYLAEARGRLHALGARSTADIFGLVTTVEGPLEVGQDWEKVSPNLDVVLPMVYPSHYPHGSFGIANPNAEPYKIVNHAIARARERDHKLGIQEPEHIRPWLQAFSLGKPDYGAAQLEAQKQAVYDAGYDGWVLWNPGSIYDPVMAGLEKTFVSRKKAR
jgi:hypothetical protein